MAALFGPLASLGASYGYPQVSGLAPAYPTAGATQAPWWHVTGLSTTVRPKLANGSPVYPAPPVRDLDTPTGVASFGPPPAPTLTGIQQTHADRLFGPFAKLGKSSLAYGPGMLGAVPFPNG